MTPALETLTVRKEGGVLLAAIAAPPMNLLRRPERRPAVMRCPTLVTVHSPRPATLSAGTAPGDLAVVRGLQRDGS